MIDTGVMYSLSGIRAAHGVLPYLGRDQKTGPEAAAAMPARGKAGRPIPADAEERTEESARDSGTFQASGGPGVEELTESQQDEVKDLAARDREVRAHEAAHQAAAGNLGGGATFEYKTGPDGKSYAVGGEVPIDMSTGRTPEETIRRAEQVQAAALAPADPSPQDLAVAAAAARLEAMARQQQMQQATGSKGGAPMRPRAAGAQPAAPTQERSVDSQHFQAIASVYAERATQVQSTGTIQRLASRAITAYNG